MLTDWILKAKEGGFLADETLGFIRRDGAPLWTSGHFRLEVHEACKRRCQASVEICVSGARRRGGLGIETSES